MRRFVVLVSKIRSLRNLSLKKLTYLKVLKNLKGKCNGFRTCRQKSEYIHTYFFQGIIKKKTKHTKITPWKGRYININYHINKQILYNNNNNNNNK